MPPEYTNLDAAQSAIFSRESEVVKAKAYEVDYPDLKGRDLVQVQSDVHPGATQVTYNQFDRVGKAKIIINNAKDIPRADVFGKQFSRPVREIALSYGYNLKEIQTMALTGRPLNPMRAKATRRGVEEIIDEVCAFGDVPSGILSGLLNSPDVTIDAATGAWSGLTPTQIIADVTALAENMDDDTNGILEATDLVLPNAVFTYIKSTPYSTLSETSLKTVIEDLLDVKISKWYRLKTAGAGDTTRGLFYKNDPDVVHQDIPMELQFLPPQEDGLEFVVIGWAMTAGVAFPKVRGIRYMDGL